MTHVLLRNLNPSSTSAGQEVRKAVTVVETPPMKVLGVRGYIMDPYGLRTAGEVWCEPDDLPDGLTLDSQTPPKGKETPPREGSPPSDQAEYQTEGLDLTRPHLTPCRHQILLRFAS